VIEVEGLTKRYGTTLAVDDLSFRVRPGLVTGFLGPNGAGKSTTMRMVVGLDHPTSGRATVNGRPYAASPAPMREVGALIDAKDVHGGRTARNHLRAVARSNGLPDSRVDTVLGLTGLEAVAGRRIKGFSLGMGQRLGIATALLGDPGVVMFDEPVNGLDPEGILWIRNLLRGLAAEGRTVLVSSHLMSEMAQTADHLIVIGRGRLLADLSMTDFLEQSGRTHVQVKSPRQSELAPLLQAAGGTVEPDHDVLAVHGLTCEQVGDIAAAHGLALHQLFEQRASLEAAFMDMTRDSVEYGSGTLPPPPDATLPPPPDPTLPTPPDGASPSEVGS
jgi:ABC-2 type transport system ATP-binding protein